MNLLGQNYPGDREERQERLDFIEDQLDDFDTEFFQTVDTENGGFYKAANDYALNA